MGGWGDGDVLSGCWSAGFLAGGVSDFLLQVLGSFAAAKYVSSPQPKKKKTKESEWRQELTLRVFGCFFLLLWGEGWEVCFFVVFVGVWEVFGLGASFLGVWQGLIELPKCQCGK